MPSQSSSHLDIVHIVSCIVAFAGFTASFVAGMTCIIHARLLKAKRISVLHTFFSALDSTDRLAYRMVAFGFLMLTLGIISGSLWSQSIKGAFWSWDPKETWSLITWLVYAAYLHVRVLSGWRSKWTNCLLVAGFTCVLVTIFGVNYLTNSWHKFG
jgi:ABC-type transport system involved in cytochrome c biogenesis permease subunit